MGNYVETFAGFEIYRDASGYTAQRGCIGLGYCISLDEIREEIDKHNADDLAFECTANPEPWFA